MQANHPWVKMGSLLEHAQYTVCDVSPADNGSMLSHKCCPSMGVICITMSITWHVLLHWHINYAHSCRLVSLLQFEAFIVFKICWVSILDYIAFMLDCNWDHFGTSQVVNHVYFTDQGEEVMLSANRPPHRMLLISNHLFICSCTA